MKPEKKARLMAVYDDVALMVREGREPKSIVAHMIDDHGATYKFTGGTYVLRCEGIAGSSTAGAMCAVPNWRKAVTLAIAKANVSELA